MSKPWGKVPSEVVTDGELGNLAVRLYAALAMNTGREGGGVKPIGIRLLAEMVKAGKSATADAMRELVERGHVKTVPGAKGARALYLLTAACHSPRMDAGVVVYAEGGVTVTRKKGVTRLAKVG